MLIVQLQDKQCYCHYIDKDSDDTVTHYKTNSATVTTDNDSDDTVTTETQKSNEMLREPEDHVAWRKCVSRVAPNGLNTKIVYVIQDSI